MALNYEVKLTKLAKKDVHGILHFVMTNYSSASATKTYEDLLEKFAEIGKMPLAYPVHYDPRLDHKNELRFTIAKKAYKIFFSIEEANGVLIVRVKHVKSSPDTIRRALLEEE